MCVCYVLMCASLSLRVPGVTSCIVRQIHPCRKYTQLYSELGDECNNHTVQSAHTRFSVTVP